MHKPFSRSRVLAFLTPQRSWRSFLIAVLAAMIALDAQAGTTEQKNLFEAVRLSDQGKFAEAVQLLDSIVHSDPSAVSDAGRGMAWNALGTLRMLMGENQASRECLENAIRLLSNIPASSRSYASALANLGSLEMSSHAYDEAAKLLNKAHDVDARAEDHAGLQQIALYRTTLSISAKEHTGRPTKHRGGISRSELGKRRRLSRSGRDVEPGWIRRNEKQALCPGSRILRTVHPAWERKVRNLLL
jgi:tetratricopeptide (TPR) repeat protein